MTKKIIVYLSLVLILSFQVKAQTLRLPEDGFMEGWEKHDKSLHFNRGGLYEYINGGAELFLEFGFEELFVQHYRKGNHEISLEVYCMEIPEAALGIYLMKCGQETPLPEIKARNSADRLQFLIVKNNYFLLVNNFKGEEKLIPVMIELTNETLKSVPSENPVKIFSFLPEENFVEGSRRIIRGPFSLQSLYTLGKGDILQLRGKVFAVSGEYTDSDGKTYTRIIVPYIDKDQAREAYMHLLSNLDPYLKTMEKDSDWFTFKDYKNQYGIVLLRKNIIDIKVNLKSKPKKGSRLNNNLKLKTQSIFLLVC